MRPSVISLINLPDRTIDRLKAEFSLHCMDGGVPLEEVASGCESPVRAVVTNGTTGISGTQIASLPELEIVCAFGAGYEGIDLVAAKKKGVVVTHAPGTNASTVADHAIGFMLALVRRFEMLTQLVRDGRWATSRAARPTLTGSTVGIVGMGRVGRMVANRAVAFDARVTYFDVTAQAGAPGVFCGDLRMLARASDFLVLTCPGGAATHHLVDRSVLRELGSDGYLINVSRGSVVDTAGLIEALEFGEIAGAGLDVVEAEPAVPAPLLSNERVLLTPHVAGRSPVSQRAQEDLLIDNLKRHFAGDVVRFAVSA